MSDQSNLSELSKKQLLKAVIPYLLENDYSINPYINKDIYDECWDVVTTLSKIYGRESQVEDIEFFSKLLSLNSKLIEEYEETNDVTLSEKLVLPEIKPYQLNYNTWGTCNYTEFYKTKVWSYDNIWVEPGIRMSEEDGNWYTGEGDYRNQPDYENYEESGWEIDSIKEYPSEPIKEQTFNKTSKVISTLDKESLLELRKIIDSRLRLL
jgi:hypothetical protein